MRLLSIGQRLESWNLPVREQTKDIQGFGSRESDRQILSWKIGETTEEHDSLTVSKFSISINLFDLISITVGLVNQLRDFCLSKLIAKSLADNRCIKHRKYKQCFEYKISLHVGLGI